MARPITLMAVFFLTMNLFSGMVMASGVGAMIGVDTAVGGDDKVSEAVDEQDNISSGAPTGQTLFGMYNALSEAVGTLAAPVTAGPTMLRRAGVPSAITHDFLQPIIAIVYAIGIISFLRGWGL